MNTQLKKYAPLISSIFTLVIYIFTMSRGVMPIDAGELAASQYTLGISHPSGYPLFNILGFLWSRLPIGSIIFRLNLLCAIWVALANFFMVKTAFLILQNTLIKQLDKKPAAKNNPTVKISQPILLQMLASISGILTLAFCKTWWIQSAGVEVYALQVALWALFFFVFIKTYYKSATTYKDWLITGLFLGLCFTNHLTSILILPGVIILYFLKMKFTKNSIKSGLVMVSSGAIVFLAFYGFMMMRADSSPLVNYGNPNNMEYLKRHVTGWQFQAFMGGDDKKTNDSIVNFFKFFSNQSMVVGLLLFIAGIIFSFMKNPRMGIFWGLHIFCTLIYISQYNIHDIENYFLLGYMSAGVFMAFGLYWILRMIKEVEKNKAVFLVLLLPILPLMVNYKTSDQHTLAYIDEYSIAALNSVEKDAIILSREWDVFVSPVYYYHLIEKQRPDVLILDKELMRRSWYHHQIKAWDKTFAGKIDIQAEAFKETVLPFERKEKFNPALIQQKFEAYITAVLNEYKNRPVYLSSIILKEDLSRGIDVKLPAGSVLVPDAYFYRVVPNDTGIYYPLSHPLEYNVHFTEKKKDDYFQMLIYRFSLEVLSARVGYEIQFGKNAEAKKIVEVMQTIDPTIQMPEGL